ncbi:MAG: prenyltransferase [Pseudomonadota bacterium]
MDGALLPSMNQRLAALEGASDRILDIQLSSGAIPWFENGPWDPWNHVECAMALTVMEAHGEAGAAFDYLFESQRPDGAWLGEYGNALPMVDRDFISREKAPAVLDTNFCAYLAVGVLHYLEATGDIDRVRDWWPMVRAAMDFVLGLQRPDGAIPWSFEAVGTNEDDALLAGNASIAKSLECAIVLAQRLDKPEPGWIEARQKLVEALRNNPAAFDRRGTGARFAMDWYYPVLSGVLDKAVANARIRSGWSDFVTEWGCRCLSDEPWITVAETCELVLTLVSMDEQEMAEQLFQGTFQHQDSNRAFWMGWQTKEEIFWPREQPSWTQAAAILASDALYGHSRAHRVLTHSVL